MSKSLQKMFGRPTTTEPGDDALLRLSSRFGGSMAVGGMIPTNGGSGG